MKKLFSIVALLIVFVAGPVWADWSVTVTWTHSVGPNLAYEQVLYNGAEKCTVQAADPATCNFVIPELGGDVVLKAFNTQGAFSETAPIPISEAPAPPTGVIVNVTYVQP